MILSPIPLVLRDTLVRKVRRLPSHGIIHVAKNNDVTSSTVIGQVEVRGEAFMLRPAETLNLEPNEVLPLLRVQEGDVVVKGQVLLSTKGLFGWGAATIESPVNGVVESITPSTAHLLIRLPSSIRTMTAYISGRVESIVPYQSTTILTRGAWIQGVLGVGGEREGIIEVAQCGVSDFLTPNQLPNDCNGKIIVGGTNPSLDTLRALGARNASGLVTGSIRDSVLTAFLGYELQAALTGSEQIPFSIMMTEGFGAISIREEIVTIAKERVGAHASLNGTTQVRAGAVRPELIIPLPDASIDECRESESPSTLTLKNRVRVIRHPFLGREGEVVELPDQLQRLPNMVLTRVAKIRFLNGEYHLVARANLERIMT
jgi:hypothetical protein